MVHPHPERDGGADHLEVIRLSPACSQRHDLPLKPEAHPTPLGRRGRRLCEPYVVRSVRTLESVEDRIHLAGQVVRSDAGDLLAQSVDLLFETLDLSLLLGESVVQA